MILATGEEMSAPCVLTHRCRRASRAFNAPERRIREKLKRSACRRPPPGGTQCPPGGAAKRLTRPPRQGHAARGGRCASLDPASVFPRQQGCMPAAPLSARLDFQTRGCGFGARGELRFRSGCLTAEPLASDFLACRAQRRETRTPDRIGWRRRGHRLVREAHAVCR